MTHPSHTPPIATPTGDIVARRAPFSERFSWALYDFANTIFSMNIASLYFAVWLVSDLGASNTVVAVGNGISSLLVALSIPVFGAISDITRRRKPWVIGMTVVSCAATAAIGVVGQTMVPLVGDSMIGGTGPGSYVLHGLPLFAILAALVVANYAHQGALPFYNAMMPELAPPEEWGRISGFGAGLGYAGSIAGVLLVAPFFNGALPVLGPLPAGFIRVLRQIPFTEHAGRVSVFAPTGLLVLLFSLPLFLRCADHMPRTGVRIDWKRGFREVAHTLEEAKHYPGTIRFLLASFLYQDAMGTIISYMALYAVEAMGFAKGAEVTLFVVLTVPAVIGAFIAGPIVDRIGPKRTLSLVILAWIVLLAALIAVPSKAGFWAVGFLIGSIYGGVRVAERPMLLTLIPDAEGGRFFGLMVLSARAAAIVGPLVWGITVDALVPSMGKAIAYRAGVVTVAVGFVGAWLLLRGVPDRFQEQQRGARAP